MAPSRPPGWERADDVLGDGMVLRRVLREGAGLCCANGCQISIAHQARVVGRNFARRSCDFVVGGDAERDAPPFEVAAAIVRGMRECERAEFWLDGLVARRGASDVVPWSDDGFEWVEDAYEWEVEMLACSILPRALLPIGRGASMPRLGLGLYMVSPADARRATIEALRVGYRLIDTASMYQNESAVGQALRESGVPRGDVFIVSKVNNPDHGYQEALRACELSRSALGIDQIDLYLIHSPLGGRVLETWDALLEARRRGWVKQVGVSNFGIDHLQHLVAAGREMPAVNQFELSPFCQERALRDFCARKGIAVMGYSPLTRGERLAHPVCASLALKHRRTPAQVLIRWALQQGIVSIPKSTRRERLAENLEALDFELHVDDVKQLGGLEERLHTCWDCLQAPWQG